MSWATGSPLYLLANWQPVRPADRGWLRELPSRMLNARRAVVSFTGRDGELAQLRQWRDRGPRLAVRWLHGPGGQGKTRLAAQLAAVSAAAGWKVIAAFHGPDADPIEPGSQDMRLVGAAGLLVIVDYADRWLLTNLTWLFKNSLLHKTGVKTRVLMIARTPDSWPRIRGVLDAYQASTSSQPLTALARESGERKQAFTTARDSFADIYQLPEASGITPPDSLDDPEFGLTLAVHMAALVMVDAQVTRQRPPRSTADLTMYLLNREQLHWARLYGDGAVMSKPMGNAYGTSPVVMNQAVFTAALTGNVTVDVGVVLLENLHLPQPRRVLRDHVSCYPPASRATVLEPLYPDRLAEDFLALTLPGHSAEYPTQPWAASTLETLVKRRGDQQAPTGWTPRAITFLASAADRWPHIGPGYLYPLLLGDPQLALDAGSAALTTLADLPTIPPAILEAIEARLTADRHVHLDAGIAAITRRFIEQRLAHTQDPAERVPLYLTLGTRLANAGLVEQALDATSRAVNIYRTIESSDVEARARSGRALRSLGVLLSAAGRQQESEVAIEEALAEFRDLAGHQPEEFEPDLAASLNNLSMVFSFLGRREEAL
jgi:tetratricopeptide (TPR) repeat protein